MANRMKFRRMVENAVWQLEVDTDLILIQSVMLSAVGGLLLLRGAVPGIVHDSPDLSYYLLLIGSLFTLLGFVKAANFYVPLRVSELDLVGWKLILTGFLCSLFGIALLFGPVIFFPPTAHPVSVVWSYVAILLFMGGLLTLALPDFLGFPVSRAVFEGWRIVSVREHWAKRKRVKVEKALLDDLSKVLD